MRLFPTISMPILTGTSIWNQMVRAILMLFIPAVALTGINTGHSDAAPNGDSGFKPSEIHFVTRVLPVLESRCQPCHGRDREKIKGGLSLMNSGGFAAGGENFSDLNIIEEGHAEPLLIRIISRTVPDLEMPPKQSDSLKADEIDSFRIWMNSGSPWPSQESIASIRQLHATGTGELVKTSGGLSADWDNRRYRPDSLWAYRPLSEVEIPKSPEIENPIDRILEKTWKKLGIEPAPMADSRTLIRRLKYTLHGLPPDSGTEEFQEAESSTPMDDPSWNDLVDRLLADPAYGEKFGRHWLDLVRYADSAGLANDFIRGSAWRYRDYVIRSFNSDRPWKEFVLQQLAGDELPGNNPDNLIATGFLRMGPWELTAMEVPRIARQKFLDDVTDITGQVFLSQPLQCARCHDHKFDPVPTRDYYSFQAVFEYTQIAEAEVPWGDQGEPETTPDRQVIEKRRQWHQQTLRDLDTMREEAQKEWCRERGLPPMTRSEAVRKGLPEGRLPPRHAGFSVRDYGMDRIARKGLQRLSWEKEQFEPVAHVVYNGAWPDISSYNSPRREPEAPWDGAMETVAILKGGDPFSPLEDVDPGALSVLDGIGTMPPIADSRTGRRRALARWITAPDNALALRSIANRVWLWTFNRGLVETPNHFGVTTPPPAHPELLDFLARYFEESGGSIKALNRLILTSRAWRRSSFAPDRRDETGILRSQFACFTPRRLTAEEIRDSQLKVTGLLNRSMGGPPVKPMMEMETALQPRMVMGTFAEAWQPSIRAADRNRRSIYTLQLRGLRDPFMEVFDAPSPDLSCPIRGQSAIPTQVMALINNPSVLSRAVFLASQIAQPAGTEHNQKEKVVSRAFQAVFGRLPSPVEMDGSLHFLQTMEAFHKQNAPQAVEIPGRVTRHAVEENTGEPFTFTELLPAYQLMEPDPWIGDLPPSARAAAELIHQLLNSNEFFFLY